MPSLQEILDAADLLIAHLERCGYKIVRKDKLTD
jgi:hypothetical protein